MTASMLTTGAVARMFCVTVETVRNWQRSGKLLPKMVMPGGKRVYAREQVDKFRKEAEARARNE